MSDADFTKRMARAPDEELLLVISSDEFLPSAKIAAKAELDRRNLEPDDLARVAADVQAHELARQNRASLPLNTGGKVAFFLFGPAVFWSIRVAYMYKYRGYLRKSEEAFQWAGYGTSFWFALALIVMAISWFK